MADNLVAQHYTRGNLLDAVLDGLRQTGHDPDALDPDALAPFEEFHTFGRMGTVALADAAGINADDHVLDVGSGVGGPARTLARQYGCRVTGIDLTQELCDVAEDLTRRVGLADRVSIRQGDATDMPFEDGSFDVAWTQHVSMNIADKPRLYQEMRRVVRPGGRLAFFDILAGPTQPIYFPVPWAEDQSTSFLATADETQAMLDEAGFKVRMWDDITLDALGFYTMISAAPAADPAPLGMHLLIPDLATKGLNLKRATEEGRTCVIRCVADAR